MIKGFILNALKGFGMGAANVVPGVSGGTVALITGIYSDIVDSLNSLTEPKTWSCFFKGKFREFWACVRGTFLLALGIGLIISVFSLAKAVSLGLENYPVLTWSFFFGLVLASAIVMFRGVKVWKLRDVLFAVCGVALGVAICTLSPNASATTDSLWYIFLCGAVSICAMILPGLSGSFIMILFGKYDYIMNAVAVLDWRVLAVFALGCVVGLLAFAKLLHWLLARWEKQTMLVLLGFVVGSLIKIWPWQDAVTGLPIAPGGQIIGAVICCIVGVAMVVGIDLIASKKR